MKFSEIQQIANFYGFDLKDMSNIYPYSNRKKQTIGISDRRSGEIKLKIPDRRTAAIGN
ncbi:MAG: hypothetical protein HC815_36115 [Richelia sp. RM1_1_1]|nr:hypothetical protein [Richelia sp. RM1_1_1]